MQYDHLKNEFTNLNLADDLENKIFYIIQLTFEIQINTSEYSTIKFSIICTK